MSWELGQSDVDVVLAELDDDVESEEELLDSLDEEDPSDEELPDELDSPEPPDPDDVPEDDPRLSVL